MTDLQQRTAAKNLRLIGKAKDMEAFSTESACVAFLMEIYQKKVSTLSDN